MREDVVPESGRIFAIIVVPPLWNVGVVPGIVRNLPAPVAQWIEHRPPEPGAGVRIASGVPRFTVSRWLIR